ncbi:UDP-N-acetylglucosamine-N-acetylmuramylpentapeptide N-acetylglucosamine transferase [Spirosomataceae bacterium TFI 002]|nr:UDP-N-acetylglucosamine-N-acetylmuramylpentapeptide N-acetylglucosamine transferase [Spirosomataceae bacterium TFI 002]
MKNTLKILISGGGTGGHIYPAVAIANEVKVQFPEAQILFVGALGKMEMEKVPKAGYEIIGLPIAGINRSNMIANLGFPFKFVKSILKAYGLVKSFDPDIAIGVGGYASGPTLLVANWRGVPTLIQEQNSYAGITNKWLSKKAKKICVAYPEMEKFFSKEKIAFTGNPVRKDLIDIKVSQGGARGAFGLNPEKKTILVIGGSQGALSVNKAIAAGIDKFKQADCQLIWQTGKGFVDKAKNIVHESKMNDCYVSDFIYNMDEAYSAADVVISRAGALSVSELCLTAKPAVLVPFPNAAEDHQTMNALSLVNQDAAILVKDKNVNEELVEAALSLVGNESQKEKLAQNIKKLARPQAAELIVKEIEEILKVNK